MESLNRILQHARQRAVDKGLPYAGALTPKEAQEVLQLAPSAKLVDVRSRAELAGRRIQILPTILKCKSIQRRWSCLFAALVGVLTMQPQLLLLKVIRRLTMCWRVLKAKLNPTINSVVRSTVGKLQACHGHMPKEACLK